jgi:uncharacterized membrane protein
MSERVWMAAGLGAVTGSRSMLGLATLANELSGRRRLPADAGTPEEWLADGRVARLLGALAVGELLADKVPVLPDRIGPGPLAGRVGMGALVGAVATGAGRRALGAAAGVAGAVVGAHLAWLLRREAGRATLLPDPALGLAEDAAAVAAARELAARR